tara:strand:+ start:1525 stop:1641 length:117 start_codon:yes stop_codon:yes gene_type:complete
MKWVVVLKVPIPYTANWVFRETSSEEVALVGLLIAMIE